ncbi:hypothetical protein HAX54_043612, partial [Datura stramonium]|nr:hypothetical protein [Datura stramonium]
MPNVMDRLRRDVHCRDAVMVHVFFKNISTGVVDWICGSGATSYYKNERILEKSKMITDLK